MRRNGTDERLRELERRVIEGDLGAVLQLHQEQKRSGKKRKYHHSASFFVPVPGQHGVVLEPMNEREILVKFGDTVGVGSGPDYSRQKVDVPPLVVRGVPYLGFGHYAWYEGEGFVPFGPPDPRGAAYRSDWMRTLDRLDQGFPRPKATQHARAAILKLLTPVVNDWAVSHKREMLEAEAGLASNAVESADKEVEEAVAVLEEARRKLADALAHELSVNEEIRRLD